METEVQYSNSSSTKCNYNHFDTQK